MASWAECERRTSSSCSWYTSSRFLSPDVLVKVSRNVSAKRFAGPRRETVSRNFSRSPATSRNVSRNFSQPRERFAKLFASHIDNTV